MTSTSDSRMVTSEMTNELPYPATGELTITVRALRAQHEGAEVMVQILIENGEQKEQKSLLLTMEQYCDFKVQKGRISEEMYERLEAASEFCHALRHGEYLLSYGSNSAQMLARKLVQRGYSREVATAAAEHLAEIGLINEESDARREVEKCLRKLWGAKRIQSHLWSRGFGSEVLRELPQLLEEIDFAKACSLLIQKKYGAVPTDPNERRRMTASLARYGYTLGEIREAIQLLA